MRGRSASNRPMHAGLGIATPTSCPACRRDSRSGSRRRCRASAAPRLSQYWIAIFMATSTETEPESVKNTRSRSPGSRSASRARQRQRLLVHEPAEHHMRHDLELALHRLADMRMIVAVAGRPPRRDAVDEFAPVGEMDARALASAPPAAAPARSSSAHRAARCDRAPGAYQSRLSSMRLHRHRRAGRGDPSTGCRGRRRVRRGQQLRPVEDRVGAGEETQRLHLVGHVLAPGRQPHHRARHRDARDRDGAHEVERVEAGFCSPASGVPSTCTSMLIGTLSGCAGRVASA